MKFRLLHWASPLVVFILMVFAGSEIQAGETRHHEAHEHGVATLNVAVEGEQLYIQFESPAANIVGFEHPPRTPEQKKAVEEAIAKLKQGESLFRLPPKAESRLVQSAVHTDIEGEHSGEAEGAEDTDHHDHDAAAEGHDEDHHEAEGHDGDHGEDHDGDHDEAIHSEFTSEYQFDCKKPAQLDHLEVLLFQVFPGIEHIEVQLLTGTKQTAIELTPKKTKIEF